MGQHAIRTSGLEKSFGAVQALSGLDLEVPTGEVYGFLGPNGAGKSTTIRVLLDLIRPSSGTTEVLGLDPQSDPVAVRRRVGYLPGDFIVDGRQTGLELLTYLGNLRGGLARARIDDLAVRLDLDLSRRIRMLSRGNRQKIGLIQAVMHDPDLLILDEPTSGLDPFLQHEFAVIVREAAGEGRTVFVSSHVMSEVQQIADQVGIIRAGRLVDSQRVEQLRENALRRVTVQFDTPVSAADFAQVPGVSDIQVDGDQLICRLAGRTDPFVKALAGHTTLSLLVEEPDLEELFFKYYERQGGGDDVA